jgi:polyhydroxybutyrate depolymerase
MKTKAMFISAAAFCGAALSILTAADNGIPPTVEAQLDVWVEQGDPVFYSGGRPSLVKLPSDFDPGKQHALLVVLHPFGRSAASLMTDLWRLEFLVEGRRLIIVAPEGTVHPFFGVQFWNAMPWCCGFEPIFGPMADDSGYLAHLIDDLLEVYPIDANRIYVAGASNGGAMAHRFGMDHPEKVAAIVSHGGVLNPPAISPFEPVSVLHIHGTADSIVNYEGGQILPDWDFTQYPGARDSAAYWAELAECNGPLSTYGKLLDLDELVPGSETERQRYRGCREDIFVELWTMHGSEHDLISGVMSETEGTTLFALAMWDWLRTKMKH